MNRVLLALLALLTGLAAQAAPASARVCAISETEIEVSFCARPVPRAVATQAATGEGGGARQDRRDPQRPRPVTRPKVYLPTVLFGPDRARE